MTLLATRAGSSLNFAYIARDLSIPQTTLKRYFALLEMTFIAQAKATGRPLLRHGNERNGGFRP